MKSATVKPSGLKSNPPKSSEQRPETAPLKPPISPKWALLTAILLPGMGQVLNNTPLRGFFMVCFMIMLGLITFNLAEPDVSMVGRLAGGVFIYALSVMDAYYWAKYRSEIFKTSRSD